MKQCQGCEKDAIGYKWCADCAKKAMKSADRKHNNKRVKRRISPCEECKDTLTNTKYCRTCAKIVMLRKQRARRDIVVKRCVDCDTIIPKTYSSCRECRENRKSVKQGLKKYDIDPKWLTRGLVHYEGHRKLS